MKKSLFASALALALLAACSSENDTPVVSSGAAPVFSASINGHSTARAYDTSWENGDAIGVSGKSGNVTYANVQYTTAGDGNFKAAASEIFFQDNQPVTFTAYYPFAADAAAMGANTWRQQDQKKFDYLWAQASGSKAQPNVPFVFAHKMTKLVLTIKKGADVSFAEVKDAVLSLEGFRSEGSFDTATGEAAATGNRCVMWEFANGSETAYNAPLAVNDNDETVAYTLILFPQDLENPLPFEATLTGKQSFKATLDFTSANASAGDTDAKNEWVAGRQYNLSVTLHKTALTVDGCTITPWTPADGGNIDAK